MIRFIHYSWSLEKQLGGLRKAGKKAELAVHKYETIFNDIRQYGCQCKTVLNQRTRNGEARIKNCVKYDLGGGYRVVTIRADCHLFITFVGSHDATDQWIENHRYDTFVPCNILYRCEERVVGSDIAVTTPAENPKAEDVEDGYEDQLSARLDESQLKSIFQGLFMNPPLATDKTDR
jgi:hypothetical protein